MFFAKLRLVAAAFLLTVGASAVLASQATAQKPNAAARTIEKPAGAATVSDDTVDLEMLECAWVDAVNRRDEAVVSRIIADDFAGVDSGGGRFTKTSYLLDVRNGAFGAEPRVQEEVKVRLFGDSAVVTSRIKLAVPLTSNGLMNVYVKRQGRWRCVALQATLVQPDRTGQSAPGNNRRKYETARKYETVGSNTNCYERRSTCDRSYPTRRSPLAIFERTPRKTASALSRNPWRSLGAPTRQRKSPERRDPAARPSGPHLLYQPYTVSQSHIVVHFDGIRPRFRCRVEKIHVKAGQTVKKGDSLLDLSGTELAAAISVYRNKKTQWERDRAVRQGRQELIASHEISPRVLATAQSEESHSLLEFQIAEGKLRTLGLDNDAIKGLEIEEGDGAVLFTLRSPIDGTVLEVGAEVGGLYDTKRDLILIVPPIRKAVGADRSH